MHTVDPRVSRVSLRPPTRADVGVILDVVYNHLGPGAGAIAAFGPYQRQGHDTDWGETIDFSQRAVREWAIQNAEMWVRDYGLDGLRLDAVHAIVDDSDPHLLAELGARVKAINPSVLVISEMEIGDRRPIGAWGHDAQWEDSLHHAVHVLLTGENEGYYAKLRPGPGRCRRAQANRGLQLRRLRPEPRPGRQPRLRR